MGKHKKADVHCPECNSDRLINRGRSSHGYKNPRFQCKDCKKSFVIGPKASESKLYEYNGKQLTVSELARIKKVPRGWLDYNIKKHGIELALAQEKGPRAENLIGRQFGWLKIIGRADPRPKDTHAYWKCQCKCGNTIEVPSNSLKLGRTKSCGCLPKTFERSPQSIDILGQRFGLLVVIEKAKSEIFSERTRSMWLCQCDCGNTRIAKGCALRSGGIKSCGCLKKKSDRP